ncbi:DUF3147 family protein [Psychrobacillus sp. FJAT-51614]|uniref:DUF3147 family protein n=1 Tax=Psychrobacillus mangrovi TaxID=3117745 RepID=A0ABU8F5K9_9BACI
MFIIIKILSSAAIIGVVTEIAKRFPTYGGILAAMPLISLLSVLWLTVEGQTKEQIQQFTWGVIIGLPATIVMLVGVYIALKNNLNFVFAISIGLVCWSLSLVLQNKVQEFLN